MYRKVIDNGDLVRLYKPWYSFGKFKPYRNLSEEVRNLRIQADKALAKYRELAELEIIASTNVAAELETLQILLLENSDAYFEEELDNSILDKREGIRYGFNRGGNNNKKDSSSNKEQGQQKQQQSKQNTRGKPSGIPMSKLLSASIVLN